MRINWNKEILDYKDRPQKDSDGTVITVGSACYECLHAMSETEKTLSGKEKYDLCKIAKKIKKTPEANFEVEELAKIKDHVGRKGSTFLVGQVYDCLESPLPEEKPT